MKRKNTEAQGLRHWTLPQGKTATVTMAALGVLAMLIISGCNTMSGWEPDVIGSNYERVEVPAIADPLAAARDAFAKESFAHAARYYEMALAREGSNSEALIGVAAAYDRMWRFDLSETAYQRAAAKIGDTAGYLNNRGYSYLMQGNFQEAKRFLDRAQYQAPDDPVIAGNLRLLQRLVAEVEQVALNGR